MPSSLSHDFDLADLQRAVFGNHQPHLKQTSFNFNWLWILPALWLGLRLMQSYVVVGAGERAVVFNRFTGLQPTQLGEGLHFLIPWVQMPTTYDVRAQTYTLSGAASETNTSAGNANDALTALTSDGLPVYLELSVRFHVDPNNVWKLHREIGAEYVEKIVRPQIRSHVRMVVAQYPVIDVYGARRAKIMEEVNTRLRTLFAKNYIILDEALLRDVKFSPKFQQAIELKQVAQQNLQQMTYELQTADKQRRQKIIEAEGEAESIRLKAVALAHNPQLVQYEYVKSLPANVKTVVTDGRTIVNLGDALTPGVAGAATAPAPAPTPRQQAAQPDTSSGE